MKTSKYKNHFLLHFVVFLWGFTAILGKLISLSAFSLVWYRFIVAIAGIFIYLRVTQKNLRVRPAELGRFFAVGFVIALHWIAFYGAIKISNISITLVCLSSGTLFAALLEPLFFRRRLHRHEVVFGVLITLGLGLIFKVESGHTLGFAVAIFSAFSSALFFVLNGVLIKKHDATVLSFYEMLGGFVWLTLYLAVSGQAHAFALPHTQDLMLLIVLGLACTAFAFVAGTHVMKEIKPFTVLIAVALEPVYGILLAYFIFGDSEHMTAGFYLGALVILSTIIANAAMKKRITTQLNLEVLT